MRCDSRLSGVLHVLLHMLQTDRRAAVTSEKLAEAMLTNPSVIRRIFSGLRDSRFVASEKGHGGGWRLTCDPAKVTLFEIYEAVGSPVLLAIGHRTESPECLVEQSVNAALDETFRAAEATVLSRLKEITLAELAADFARRMRRSKRRDRKNYAL